MKEPLVKSQVFVFVYLYKLILYGLISPVLEDFADLQIAKLNDLAEQRLSVIIVVA